MGPQHPGLPKPEFGSVGNKFASVIGIPKAYEHDAVSDFTILPDVLSHCWGLLRGRGAVMHGYITSDAIPSSWGCVISEYELTRRRDARPTAEPPEKAVVVVLRVARP